MRRQHRSTERVRKQIRLAQNFLTSEKLVRELVAKANIDRDDTVVEIGAGHGIITAELSRRAGRVIAIEKDSRLARALGARFRDQANVKVIECDFLQYRMPTDKFKV